jgi:glycosyltransferase involved in cell wall biosynthesis
LNSENVIRILFIHHAVGWGGAPKSMIQLINSLPKDKFEVKVLLIKDSIVSTYLNNNGIDYSIAESSFYKKHYSFFAHLDTTYVKWFQFFKLFKLGVIWLLSRYCFAKKELSKHDYDVIHLNSSVLTDWLKPGKAKGKTIIHIRETFRKGKLDLLHIFFKRQMAKYADSIVAISNHGAARVNLSGKTTVIYNPFIVEQSNIDKSSYNSKRFVFVGGAQAIKGFFTLVDALPYVDESITIQFLGSYDLPVSSNKKRIKSLVKSLFFPKRNYEQYINKIKESKNAEIIGMVESIRPYLQNSCCLLSPFEIIHFSRPIIEAYLLNKPVIATNIEGMDEIVVHEKTGLLVSPNSPEKLAEAINSLAFNSELLEKLGRSGNNFANDILNKYNSETNFPKLYSKLVNHN